MIDPRNAPMVLVFRRLFTHLSNQFFKLILYIKSSLSKLLMWLLSPVWTLTNSSRIAAIYLCLQSISCIVKHIFAFLHILPFLKPNNQWCVYHSVIHLAICGVLDFIKYGGTFAALISVLDTNCSETIEVKSFLYIQIFRRNILSLV